MRSKKCVSSLLASLLQLSTIVAFEIPQPDGPYLVHVKHVELIDTTRNDPYASNASSSLSTNSNASQIIPRRLMTSVFHPVESKNCQEKGYIPYMPFETALCLEESMKDYGFGNGTLSNLHLPVCKKVKQDHSTVTSPPRILVFSHGLGTSRLMYSTLIQSMASKGWWIISVDHTYDSCAVEFPNGDIVYNANIPEDDLVALAQDVQIRTEDLNFVIDQIRNNGTESGLLPDGLMSNSNTTTINIQTWGHSLGGATAFSTAFQDPNIPSALNMDGELFEPVTTDGLGQTPAFLFSSPAHNLSTGYLDPSWPAFWNASTSNSNSKASPVNLVTLENAAHNTFTDLPLIAEVLNLNRTANVTLLIGELNGYTARKTITSVVDRWFSLTGNKTVDDSLCSFPNVQDVELRNSTFC